MEKIKLCDIIYKILIICLFISSCFNKEVLRFDEDQEENYLIASTIDGKIHLIDKYTGIKIWSTALDPITQTRGTNDSMLIANPQNGRLFIFQNNEKNEIFNGLEKTIFDYVKKSPLFMDGKLMTGSKNDRWFAFDLDTGQIVHFYKSEQLEKCPFNPTVSEKIKLLYVGICQYNLVIKEPVTGRTIYDLTLNSMATHAATEPLKNNLQIYSSSNSGLVVAIYSKFNTEKVWSTFFDSTVINFYSITKQGILSRVPFTTMSHETVNTMFRGRPYDSKNMSLKKAMYFGRSNDSWYVLTTYIQKTYRIKPLFRHKYPMLTGPVMDRKDNINNNSDIQYSNSYSPFIPFDSSLYGSYKDLMPVDGFYESPKEYSRSNSYGKIVSVNNLIDFDREILLNEKSNNAVMKYSTFSEIHNSKNVEESQKTLWLQLFVAFMLISIVILLWILLRKKSSVHERSILEEDGGITVGDIIYYPEKTLGRGMNGTTVFEGIFKGNNKEVAVKRLIKTEQSQYELEFLRQSFDCQYLIKCFYITHSLEFTYLALELCDCTLESYVTDEKFRENCRLDKLTVIHQMMSGVLFLHQKRIVHRDLKPRNVLLMKQKVVDIRQNVKSGVNNESNGALSEYKVVISDFGLSRQSSNIDGGGASITKTAGLLGGTSGYIAPELMREDIMKITPSADIFSCGILFYYLHTNGIHPFGADILSRQLRINEGRYDLNPKLFKGEYDNMLFYFIRRMLKSEPKLRPRAEEVLQGPLFWKDVDKLSFLCDLSDYLERADSDVQLSINKYCRRIFDDRWVDNLDDELVDLLTVQRSYNTRQVTHLIRAIRNKRNHFHELPSDVSQRLFNNSIQGLARYINQKFPLLYPILYGWVRYDLHVLPVSFQQHFPVTALPIILSESKELNDKKQNITKSEPHLTSVLPTEESNSNNGVDKDNHGSPSSEMAWRRAGPIRKRPSHPKKIRGAKSNKKPNEKLFH